MQGPVGGNYSVVLCRVWPKQGGDDSPSKSIKVSRGLFAGSDWSTYRVALTWHGTSLNFRVSLPCLLVEPQAELGVTVART